MPEEGVLSLQDLHHIVSDISLTRFDEDLGKERSARRKGRPKSSKEIKLDFKKPDRHGYATCPLNFVTRELRIHYR
ncbi:hypothetical protein BYT27DRAFT_7184248 [Phlegmacium glaucopus]|nr:hypothetical protein BYT27DRAFT_7184248 [Phlegmacium glaucopus]